jgi:hypothetical protein
MANFRYWRKMTWALLVWGAAALVFIVASGFGLAMIVIAVLGAIVLGFIWYMTRPLWMIGRGARLRPLRPIEIPVKSPRIAAQD